MRTIGLLRRDERGQVLPLVVIFLASVLLGMAALVTDVGHVMSVKRNLQASVDAAALAGAQQLPNGTAAVVGSVGAAGFQSPDMSFAPNGTLYAWSEGDSDGNRNGSDDLMQVDKTLGTAVKVGECSCGTAATGLGFDAAGRLYLKPGGGLDMLNQFTGHLYGSHVALSASPNNMLAFGPGGVAYTGTRSGASPRFTLQTVNVTTGVVATVGTNEIPNIAALAWDMGTSTPAVSDLSVTKDVDVPSPANWGDEVEFTIQVSNDGADAATGVEVTDLLSSSFTYVSDDGGGAFDSGTGVWTVGSLANGASATLHITADITSSTPWTNAAEVTAADQYDPDSVPGSGEGDSFASVTLTPTANPAVDVGATIDPKGNTGSKSKTKNFDVIITNTGSIEVTVATANLAVTVNASTFTVSCKSKSFKIRPTKRKRFNCSFSPRTTGVTPGSTVTYTATVDLPADGFTNNDTGSAFVVAK